MSNSSDALFTRGPRTLNLGEALKAFGLQERKNS